jgi:hypothetical protein
MVIFHSYVSLPEGTSIYLPYTLVIQVVGVIPSNKKRLFGAPPVPKWTFSLGISLKFNGLSWFYHLPHVQNDSCSYTSDVT